MTFDSIKKVPFLTWIKWNAERRWSMCDWLRLAFLISMDKNDFFQVACSTNLFKISLKFTDKVPFLADLSVNFCPLWWEFTDKAGFSEHLSVKSGPKRLNFYGQTAIFAHFVRNRHFSSRPFTDRGPIFIDVYVNEEKMWKNKLCPPVCWIIGKALKRHTNFQFCAIVNLRIT